MLIPAHTPEWPVSFDEWCDILTIKKKIAAFIENFVFVVLLKYDD